MSEITNPSLKNTVRQHFASLGEDAPTWTEIHGMLCLSLIHILTLPTSDLV